ncbi:MAG: adenylyltransferase/cytidyltransferase family protein [Candidatus Krumholzibacteria bacterium]|nr:adenylyltransferase/cytidyltransferase family protein [Candidatus Krumholzibacteria bacterium]
MSEADDRILKTEDLDGFKEAHRGEAVVFTNGCFDLIHRGHVTLLARAREFGDCLVVGINSDSSLARLKGLPRPLMNENDRAFILLQFRSVDYVTVFEEDTPLETIMRLRPDVLVKGAEYGRDKIVGADLVEKLGGRVERVEMFGNHSTSGLIEKIKKGF